MYLIPYHNLKKKKLNICKNLKDISKQLQNDTFNTVSFKN